MESINIPSPSAILDLPPPPPTSSTTSSSFPPSSSTTTTTTTASRAPPARSQTTKPTPAPGNKPRQSKSRNGCSTCKAKRLKCDESKPSCLQCERRKVQCGGYKKDFKWRPFEETNVASRTAARGKNGIVPPPVSSRKARVDVPPPPVTEHSAPSAKTQSTSAGGKKSPSKPNERRLPQDTTSRVEEQVDQSNRDTLSEKTPESWLEDLELPGPSPWISDVSPSSADLESTPFGMMLSSSPSKSDSFSFSALLAGDGEEIEDIVRQSEPSAEPWLLIPDMGLGLSSSADDDTGHMATGGGSSSIPRGPDLGLGSPEMLALRFNRVTCGILSVKDGMHENPWRRLVWPLAKDTPALYHALFSLAAFHSCKDNPALRVHGVDHMRQSITCMVQDIRNMRTDAALATSLALAFADTWDQHTRSCIQHLRGAKALVSQVLELANRGTLYGPDLERVRFLYNTWLYMDVISRLTSREGCEVPPKMDTSIFHHLPGPGGDDGVVVHEIDPLMGCATTLFPLINQVAGLIQRVRKSDSNSISLVSQAIELKRLVEQWEPPRYFEPPEDPTSEVQHSIQVAHAYRWATLLYLHQAVPEMPSEPTSELAKRVLILLATVPPSSRTTIVQMFPLMAAGCEAEQEEDRGWVLGRWMAVQSRLMLGSIDRCIEIVREVWARQDAFLVDQERGHKRTRSSTVYDAPGSWRKAPRRNSAVTGLENIEYERTVRGRLHWVNVMDEWGWEVFLG